LDQGFQQIVSEKLSRLSDCQRRGKLVLIDP